jgi:hypothetical protein
MGLLAVWALRFPLHAGAAGLPPVVNPIGDATIPAGVAGASHETRQTESLIPHLNGTVRQGAAA